MKAIYLDCFAGVSGNMLLGALLDVGVPEHWLRDQLAKLPLNGYELVIDRVTKKGISSNYVDVKTAWHHHHHHRHLPDILKIINSSTLVPEVKEGSIRLFRRLAEAEAKVHGTTVDKIHFHEVGAVDSIVDIVGVMLCLHYLDVSVIYTSKLHVGSGFVKCSHGLMPVPAPATAELLKGIPYYSADIVKELVTPTGAAVVAEFGVGYGAMPEGFVVDAIGYGAGTWDLDIPNVLRLHLGRLESQSTPEVIVIETNIDDMNPQLYGYVFDKLLKSGALDVWVTPIVMKKSRPANMLSVLVEQDRLDTVLAVLFAETSTIGIRYYPVSRTIATRSITTVETKWGSARAKISVFGDQVCNISPEFEDCRKLAEEHNIPLKNVQHEVARLAYALDSMNGKRQKDV